MTPGPITVLTVVDRGLISEHALVYAYHDKSASYHWRSVDTSFSSGVMIDYEGISWIRGHHAPDSKEVAALHVAYALGRTT